MKVTSLQEIIVNTERNGKYLFVYFGLKVWEFIPG